MKRSIIAFVFYSLLILNNSSAQSNASGSYSFSGNESGFTKIGWDVTYRFVLDKSGEGKGTIYLYFSGWGKSVTGAQYQYSGKTYSPADLGFSNWPVLREKDDLTLDLNIIYKGEVVKSFSGFLLTDYPLLVASFVGGKDMDDKSATIGRKIVPYNGFNIQDLTATFRSPAYHESTNQMGSEEIIKKIKAKNNSQASNAISERSTIIISSPPSAKVVGRTNTSVTNNQPQSYYSNQQKTTTNTDSKPTWQETNTRIQAENQQRYQQQQQRMAEQQKINQQNADAITNSATELVGMIGNIISQNREEKARKEQRRLQQEQDAAEGKRQAQEQLNEIARQKKLTLELRNSFFTEFPEGGVPLSSQKLPVNVLYYFTYIFDKGTIANDKPEITLSNIFPVAQYGDGTWPFKTNITSDINKLKTNGELTLVGYFSTTELAEQMRNSFLDLAGKSNMLVKDINYKGRPASSAGEKMDFWGNESKTAVSKPSRQNKSVDFWGGGAKDNQKKATDTTSKKMLTDDDFWAPTNSKPIGTPKKTIIKKVPVKKG